MFDPKWTLNGAKADGAMRGFFAGDEAFAPNEDVRLRGRFHPKDVPWQLRSDRVAGVYAGDSGTIMPDDSTNRIMAAAWSGCHDAEAVMAGKG